MRARTPWAIACVVILLAACDRQPGLELEMQPLNVPAASGSLAPNWAGTAGGDALLSWLEHEQGNSRLLFARYGDDGWTAPQEIAAGSDWFVNWADFPALIALDDQRMVAHWLKRSGTATYAYDIVLARSTDAGNSWQPLGSPHRDGTPTEHGFVAYYPYVDAQGARQAGLVWLDGRQMQAESEHAAMSLRHARIRANGSLMQEQELDALTCDCCQTAAVASGGAVLVAYRDRSENEIRDIRLLRNDGQGWQDRGLIREDGWEIPGCPVNGPALAADGETVAIAWFSGAGGQSRVRAGISRDAGRSFAVIDIDDDATAGRVDVALTGELLAVSWLSGTEADGALKLQLFDLAGKARSRPLTMQRIAAGRASGFPQLQAYGQDLLLAWTAAGASGRQVRAARLKILAR